MLQKFISALIVGLLLLLPCVLSDDIQITGFVNDYAKIITPEYVSQIELILKNLQDTKTAEFAIVIIPSLNGQSMESVSLNLAQGKLGDKSKNNGLLLLISLQDRQYRFEVGRGLEGELNDAKIGRIGRTYLQPNFKNGDYGKGIYESAIAVKDVLYRNESSEIVQSEKFDKTQLLITLIPFIILFILVIGVASISSAHNNKQKERGKYFEAATMAALLFGGKGRGGMGGFSGGGGFGGFGGGGFGGGGAGGHW
jgi:uncharacterized protein